MPVTFITLKMVFVLAWSIGDTSSLACQSLNQVQVSIKKIHGVTALWHMHLLHSFSFSTIFGLNSCELRMHWKPKSKWPSNREGIDQQAHVEEFSSDDFQVEPLLGSCGYINVSRYTIGPGSFLSFASFWEPGC
jgi:hypothetical protein